MKIALVSEWLDPWRGGAEQSTWQFVQHVLDAGVEVHLLTRSRPSPTPRMHVHTIAGASMSRTRRSVTFAHRVQRLIASEPFDLVHAISPCPGADIYQPRGGTIAETIQRNIALRQSSTGRSFKKYANYFNFKQRYNLAMERQLLAADGVPIIVALSDYVVFQLKEHYQLPDCRIRKVFNGVDPDVTPQEQRLADREAIRRELSFSPDDVVVVSIAHNFRLKGIRRWMEALAILLARGQTHVKAMVLGKGDSQPWHRLAVKLGIANHLTFLGPCDRICEYLHAGDVLVHPTYYDPCSRVVLEAMAAGLPVITTRWDGSSEVVKHGENGFVLSDPDRVEELASLVEVLLDRTKRETMGAAAKTVCGLTSMARHAEQMIELYESIGCQAGVKK